MGPSAVDALLLCRTNVTLVGVSAAVAERGALVGCFMMYIPAALASLDWAFLILENWMTHAAEIYITWQC